MKTKKNTCLVPSVNIVAVSKVLEID